jgi:hypothetical protein
VQSLRLARRRNAVRQFRLVPARRRRYRRLKVRVDGQLAFNTATLILTAAVAGFGLAYLTGTTSAAAA